MNVIFPFSFIYPIYLVRLICVVCMLHNKETHPESWTILPHVATRALKSCYYTCGDWDIIKFRPKEWCTICETHHNEKVPLPSFHRSLHWAEICAPYLAAPGPWNGGDPPSWTAERAHSCSQITMGTEKTLKYRSIGLLELRVAYHSEFIISVFCRRFAMWIVTCKYCRARTFCWDKFSLISPAHSQSFHAFNFHYSMAVSSILLLKWHFKRLLIFRDFPHRQK